MSSAPHEREDERIAAGPDNALTKALRFAGMAAGFAAGGPAGAEFGAALAGFAGNIVAERSQRVWQRLKAARFGRPLRQGPRQSSVDAGRPWQDI